METYENTKNPDRNNGKIEERPAAKRFCDYHNFNLQIVSVAENMFHKLDVIINDKWGTDVKCTTNDREISMTFVNTKKEKFLETTTSEYILFELNKKVSYFVSIKNLVKWLSKNRKGLLASSSKDGSEYITFYPNELEQIEDVIITHY